MPDTYTINTKKGMLSTELTHNIRPGKSSFDPSFKKGKKLKERRRVKLPQYRIYLGERDFWFSLAQEPRYVRANAFGIIPTYQYLHPLTYWTFKERPCYERGRGTTPELRSTIEDYIATESWSEKAKIAAVFLQSAIPHYGETWYRTSFAYRLGLVGHEVLEKVTTKTQ